MDKKKELFINDLDEDGIFIHSTIEDAHLRSVQTAINRMYEVISDDKNYSIDVTPETDLIKIEKACTVLKKAIQAKYISKYTLVGSQK